MTDVERERDESIERSKIERQIFTDSFIKVHTSFVSFNRRHESGAVHAAGTSTCAHVLGLFTQKKCMKTLVIVVFAHPSYVPFFRHHVDTCRKLPRLNV